MILLVYANNLFSGLFIFKVFDIVLLALVGVSNLWVVFKSHAEFEGNYDIILQYLKEGFILRWNSIWHNKRLWFIQCHMSVQIF